MAQPVLSADELATWRTWLTLTTALPAALNRQLMSESGLTLQDYDVLVQLAAAPERRLRIGALADAVHWERSRLSHHVARMVQRGLVEREPCPDDARGNVITLTRVGARALRQTTAGHHAAIRDLVFGALAGAERQQLGALLHRVALHLDNLSV